MGECYVDRNGLSTKNFIMAPQNKFGKPAFRKGDLVLSSHQMELLENHGHQRHFFIQPQSCREWVKMWQLSVDNGADDYGFSPLTYVWGS